MAGSSLEPGRACNTVHIALDSEYLENDLLVLHIWPDAWLVDRLAPSIAEQGNYNLSDVSGLEELGSDLSQICTFLVLRPVPSIRYELLYILLEILPSDHDIIPEVFFSTAVDFEVPPILSNPLKTDPALGDNSRDFLRVREEVREESGYRLLLPCKLPQRSFDEFVEHFRL